MATIDHACAEKLQNICRICLFTTRALIKSNCDIRNFFNINHEFGAEEMYVCVRCEEEFLKVILTGINPQRPV